jgi:hypothetical protein
MRRQRFGGLYEDAADIGVAFAYLRAIVAIIISIILIIIGVYQRSRPDIYTSNIKFTVKTVAQQYAGVINGKPKIDYNLTGIAEGCPYPITVNSYPNKVSPGQVINDLYMRPKCNGSDAIRTPVSNSTSGNWLIGIGIFIIIGSIVYVYFMSRYKGLAAVSAANDVYRIFK